MAALPRPERAVLAEWLKAQRCAQEMLSLACGHLRVMRTSLLDVASGAEARGQDGLAGEAETAALSTDEGSCPGQDAASETGA